MEGGVYLMAMGIRWNRSADELLRERQLQQNQAAQAYIDSSVLRCCDPYVPRDTGQLIKSGIRGTKIGSGRVIYQAPYARRWYYTPARFRDAPTRGNYWFERMKATHGKQILAEAARIAGGRT